MDEVAPLRARRDPETECAVDVKPGVGLPDDLDDLGERIVRARVHLSSLGAHDHRGLDLGKRCSQAVWLHPALRIRRDDDEL